MKCFYLKLIFLLFSIFLFWRVFRMTTTSSNIFYFPSFGKISALYESLEVKLYNGAQNNLKQSVVKVEIFGFWFSREKKVERSWYVTEHTMYPHFCRNWLFLAPFQPFIFLGKWEKIQRVVTKSKWNKSKRDKLYKYKTVGSANSKTNSNKEKILFHSTAKNRQLCSSYGLEKIDQILGSTNLVFKLVGLIIYLQGLIALNI